MCKIASCVGPDEFDVFERYVWLGSATGHDVCPF